MIEQTALPASLQDAQNGGKFTGGVAAAPPTGYRLGCLRHPPTTRSMDLLASLAYLLCLQTHEMVFRDGFARRYLLKKAAVVGPESEREATRAAIRPEERRIWARYGGMPPLSAHCTLSKSGSLLPTENSKEPKKWSVCERHPVVVEIPG